MRRAAIINREPAGDTLSQRWLAALERDDFATAFAINDAVLAQRDPATRDDRSKPYHERWVWDGRPVDGGRVLVRCYHGLGDTVQFARYLRALAVRADSVTVETQPALIPLLARLAAPLRLLPFRPEAPLPAAECDIEIMELAHALRLPPMAVPPPYLSVPTQRVEAVAARLGAGSGAFRIGLCWRCGAWETARSISLAALARTCLLPGLEFVSLQRGSGALDAVAPDAPRFLNPEDRSSDVLDTAALIQTLDLVITIDTFVAHLAGALGAPVWLLLKAEADWRWTQRRADSPWYPTMRLYRQRHAGDWLEPLAQLRQDLSVWAQQRRSGLR